MKKKLLAVALPLLVPVSVLAAGNPVLDGADSARGDKTPGGLFGDADHPGAFHTIANLGIAVAGAIAVLVLIAGGVMYITSTGEAKRIQQAKDTILYAVIGLVVVILSYAIINFVSSQLTK